MKKTILFLYLLSFIIISWSQSSSVIDAQCFNQNDIQPPFKIGKGFNISDIFKQTKFCFTPETSDPELLTTNSGSKISIKLYYTKNDEQYNILKSQGVSGKISYLNLFSLGGHLWENLSSSIYENNERLVFVAKVDFGAYSYNSDPKLNTEAQSLIDGGRYSDFINYYGTHYISGVRRENSIWITLNRKIKSSNNNTSDGSGLSAGINIPLKPSGTFEISEGEETETFFDSDNISIDIQINGLSIDASKLEIGISEILKDKNSSKISGIKSIISSALSPMPSPDQGLISQYYFTPFELYGLKTVYWDNQKEIALAKINENVIRTAIIKNKLDQLTSSEGLSTILKEYDDYVLDYNQKENYRNQLKANFESKKEDLKEYRTTIYQTFQQLELKYKTCSDVSCQNINSCCNCQDLIDKSNTLIENIKNELDELAKFKIISNAQAIYEINTPECEKKKEASVFINNKSTNPYIIYCNLKQIDIIPGRTTREYPLSLGYYQFKAVQKSGYLVYATVNDRQVTLSRACENKDIYVGFED